MNLANVTVEDICFAEMAAGLSKIARFNGRYRCEAYSVAQHSVFVADALYEETGDAILAGCGLLHDGHEYLMGDIATPVAKLMEQVAAQIFIEAGHTQEMAGFAANAIEQMISRIKADLDRAIFGKCGINYPGSYPIYARKVKQMDARMLRAEGIALFGPKAKAHLPAASINPPKLRGVIQPWGAMKAELAFLDRLEKYLNYVARAV